MNRMMQRQIVNYLEYCVLLDDKSLHIKFHMAHRFLVHYEAKSVLVQ